MQKIKITEKEVFSKKYSKAFGKVLPVMLTVDYKGESCPVFSIEKGNNSSKGEPIISTYGKFSEIYYKQYGMEFPNNFEAMEITLIGIEAYLKTKAGLFAVVLVSSNEQPKVIFIISEDSFKEKVENLGLKLESYEDNKFIDRLTYFNIDSGVLNKETQFSTPNELVKNRKDF